MPVSARRIRELSREVRRNDPKLLSPTPMADEPFLAIITPTGPTTNCDFCDYRYWVREAVLSQVKTTCPPLGDCICGTGEDQTITPNVTAQECAQLGQECMWNPYPPDPCRNPVDLDIPWTYAYSGSFIGLDTTQQPIWAPAINLAEVGLDFKHELPHGTAVIVFPLQDITGEWFLAFNPGGGTTTEITEGGEPTRVTECKIDWVAWNRDAAQWIDAQECSMIPGCISTQYTENADRFDEVGPFLVCREVTGYTPMIPENDIDPATTEEVVDPESRLIVFPHSDMDIRAFVPLLGFGAQPADYQIWDPTDPNDPVYHALPMRKGLTLDFGAGLDVGRMVDTVPICTTTFPIDE